MDQLRQEVTALEKEKKDTQALVEAIGRSKMRPKVFGAEQLLSYGDQRRKCFLGC